MSQGPGHWELGDTEKEGQGGQSQETARVGGTCIENPGPCKREGEARAWGSSRGGEKVD